MKFDIKKIDLQGKAVKVVGIGGGVYGAVKANKIPWMAKQTTLTRGIIKAAAGAFLPDVLGMLMKGKGGKKGDLITQVAGHAGDGVIAVGTLEIAKSFDDTLPAIGELDTMGATGSVVFDEAYTSGVGNADVMGNTDGDEVVYD